VLAIIEAAGWPVWPLILASVLAVAIIIERAYSLRSQEVAPAGLLLETIKIYQERGVTQELVTHLADGSPLGRIFATALKNAHNSREIMKESIEESGRAVTHELDRFLTSLGTVRQHGAAARSARHGDRHDRDLRRSDWRRHQSRASSRTAFRSRSTTPPLA
jgi:Biopolymer transport proteins